jgi:hypothetical protein
MVRWLKLLGGLLIWALHFIGLYTISSIADLWFYADHAVARIVGLAFTILCLAALALMFAVIVRRKGEGTTPVWERQVALTAILVSAISIVWQALPLAF